MSDHQAAFEAALAELPSNYRSVFSKPPSWGSGHYPKDYDTMTFE